MSDVYSAPAGSAAVSGTTVQSAPYNGLISDLVQDANTPRPIVAGGTGSGTATGARSNLGLVIGTNVQSWDADLDAIAALTTTTFGRNLLTLADQAALLSAAGAQAADADLTAIAALTTTAFGRGFLTLADGPAALNSIGAVARAGDTLTGPLNFAASTATKASANIPAGTFPTSPTDGDIGRSAAGTGIQYRDNGVTQTIATVAGTVARDAGGNANVGGSLTVGSSVTVGADLIMLRNGTNASPTTAYYYGSLLVAKGGTGGAIQLLEDRTLQTFGPGVLVSGNATQLLHATPLQQVRSMVFGFGQTWQDVSGSRAINTAYQNTGTKPIQIAISFAVAASTAAQFEASPDGVTYTPLLSGSGAGIDYRQAIIIPPGHYSRLNRTSGTGTVSFLWRELS